MKNNRKEGFISPFAIHPGETIKEALDFKAITQNELAIRSGLTPVSINRILKGQQPVTLESAIKFERALGLSHELLLGLQSQYDSDKFRLEEISILESEIKLLDKYGCYQELSKLGFVSDTKDKIKMVKELLRFFGVNSLFSIKDIFPFAFVSFKRSLKKKIKEESLAAWLRIGDIKAQNRMVAEFDREKLLDNIKKMRSLTRYNPEVYSQELVELCAEAGVILVYTPHLKNTCVNGAARWISPNKALIQVSLYYAYADIFWFTLFHELGHIVKHSKKDTFIEFEKYIDKDNKEEEEANIFAARVFIPYEKEGDYELLKKTINKNNYITKIEDFSNSLGIDKGIVAGRIGKEMNIWRYIPSLRNRLKFSYNN